MNRRSHLLRVLGALLALAGIAAVGGCGQKGPLFLPEEKLDELERRRQRDGEKSRPPASGRIAPPGGSQGVA